MQELIGPRAIKMETGVTDAGAWLPATRSADELRRMARRLLEMANSLERADKRAGRSDLGAKDQGDKHEKRRDALCKLAEAIYRGRNRRALFLPDCLFSEPAWDMLLDLFARDGRGQNTSTTSICLAGHAPMTTGLRHMQILEAAGLIERRRAPHDQRLTLVGLTPAGVAAMRACLADWQEGIDRAQTRL
jgi:hypothetical protein